MQLGVPREVAAGETRVALVPETVKKLVPKGWSITVESDAGRAAGYFDAAYEKAGASIGDRAAALGSDLVLVVGPLEPADAKTLKKGAVLVGLLRPTAHPELVKALSEAGASSLSFELVPRITRAQSMDVLSSMATVAGYRAALLAAEASPRFFPMLMTAAGTITPSNALVIGAGVAGLQAIATCHRLGAIVYSYDLRPAVKEQVESLGARFVELEGDVGGGETEGGYAKEQSAEQQARQRQLLADRIAESHVVITTAAIPDRPAPRIIDAATVERMSPGSVIVDIAAETGGNCELTKAGETVETENGVRILGPVNLPAAMPQPASQMLSRNALSLLGEVAPEGEVKLDLENEIIRGSLVTLDGEVRHARSREALGLPASEGASA